MITNFRTQYTTMIYAPIEKVWEALTNPDIVKKYFFGTILTTSWKVSTPITFEGEWEGQKYIDKGEVIEYIHNKKLSYSYLSSFSGKKDIPENYLLINYEVITNGPNTVLTISQSHYDEESSKESNANWESVIDEMRKLVE